MGVGFLAVGVGKEGNKWCLLFYFCFFLFLNVFVSWSAIVSYGMAGQTLFGVEYAFPKRNMLISILRNNFLFNLLLYENHFWNNVETHETHKKYDLFVHCRNTTKYGNHSLRVLGPHIWNSLPEEIKQQSSLNAFKNYIWCGQKSKCYLCQASLK